MYSRRDELLIMAELFMLYSITGWIYEEVLEVLIYKTGFTNRGFLFGPYLPVYGAGAILLTETLCPVREKCKSAFLTPLAIFLGSMIIATVVELITSYGLGCFGIRLWNYDDYPLNFQGRIALNPSVRFGIGGVFFIYVLHPVFIKALKKQSIRTLHVTASIILIVITSDLIVTVLI